MKVLHFQPSEILLPHIHNYTLVDSEDGFENRILPNAAVVISIRLSGEIYESKNNNQNLLPLSSISGPRKNPRYVSYTKKTKNFLIKFTPLGAQRFLDYEVSEFFGQSLALDCIFKPEKVKKLEMDCYLNDDLLQVKEKIEMFLMSELNNKNLNSTEINIADVIRKIETNNGNLKIKELLQSYPLGFDSMEKKFKSIIGLSPKKYSNLIKMKNVIGKYSKKISFTNLAMEVGYFDQSHFIKDFKTFTGETPKDFFKKPFW
ncbi:helix-turn-helix domain-containing protein [Leptospira sp. 96542]|nr:helix-turn-helix domain-containing protein [Leptospira sp. 96542]